MMVPYATGPKLRRPRKPFKCCMCGHKQKGRPPGYRCRKCGIFQRLYETTISFTLADLVKDER